MDSVSVPHLDVQPLRQIRLAQPERKLVIEHRAARVPVHGRPLQPRLAAHPSQAPFGHQGHLNKENTSIKHRFVSDNIV